MLQKEGEELQILSDKNDSQGLFAALKANCGDVTPVTSDRRYEGHHWVMKGTVLEPL